MQKYQFWRTAHSQITFFIHIEATENTFLQQKKAIFHAEHETVKKRCATSAGCVEDFSNSFISVKISKVSIIFKSLLRTVDHYITYSSVKS